MMKQDYHTFKGMKLDNYPEKQESDFLIDSLNIRFTQISGVRGYSSVMSVTNERGTLETNVTLEGRYGGHCVIGKHLIVFTLQGAIEAGNKEYKRTSIYDIEDTSTNVNSPTYSRRLLYRGNLNMDYPGEHIIQTLGVYEGELVQKVYWVDGVNSPRVINIAADKLLGKNLEKDRDTIYPEGCFDFIQELNLNENIEVTREEGGGSFSAGTMQYAFSYYNKYGQESNLFYSTELLNVSFKDRGGSPEDNIANTFHITISNVETKFDYLRIYSIHRTSLDATPTVKIVADLEASSSTLVYADTNTTGDTIDPTRLLYIGGESIIAGTITEKDNTLFLGDIKISREAINENVKDTCSRLVSNKQVKEITRKISLDIAKSDNSFYYYQNLLSKGNVSTYKKGDTYRLGLQFQYKTGKWSEPIWIGDYTMSETSSLGVQGNTELLTGLQITLTEGNLKELNSYLDGYKKVRPLIVFPSVYDRTVLAQGILCPTVFSVKDRLNGSPFAQSSWFFRPMTSGDIDNNTDIDKGATVAFSHLSPLLAGSNRGAEIQNMVNTTFKEANEAAKNDKALNLNTFFVDQTILTMHSPDIEFDDSVKQALEGNDFDLNIVGLVPFKSNAGDISIQTTSAVPAPNDTGFFHKTFLSTDYSNKGMVAGMFYKSHIIDDAKDAKDFYPYKGEDSNWELNWLVYPWHRTGSLNNDITRPEGEGTRTSVLKRKVISNLRFSPDTAYLATPFSFEKNHNGITGVSVFDSNEMSLIKLPAPANSNIQNINYYGNVDSLITTNKNYTFYVCPNEGVNLKDSGAISNPFTHTKLQTIKDNYADGLVGDYQEQLKSINDPVRMKYKSSPHAVFALNYSNSKAPVLLPELTTGTVSINKYTGVDSSPFWSSENSATARESSAAIVQEEVTPTGINETWSDSKIEEETIAYLKKTLGTVTSETFVICTICSVSPTDKKYADLYTSSGNNVWSKVDLLDYRDTHFRVTDKSGYYWEVFFLANKGYVLQKIDESTVYTYQQKSLDISTAILGPDVEGQWNEAPFLLMAELRRKTTPANRFGGNTKEALQNNLWIPAGKPVNIDEPILFTYGDTYYQRYDCLKTYPFTTEDENSVVEIASFMCETRVNIDGRYDRNRGQLSNLNMSPTNFNLLNPVYSQRDNFFNYRILDDKYYKNTSYPSQIIWSQEKTYLEDVDTWTNITLANSVDLNGEKGSITSLETFNDTLIAFQKKAISQVLFNSRVQIPVSDGVPVEISNSYKVDGVRAISDTIGCEYKSHITKSPLGIYFIDNNPDTLYLYNGQFQDLSTQGGVRTWFKEHHSKGDYVGDFYNSYGTTRLSYDPFNKDLYINNSSYSPGEGSTLCYSEILGHFTSLMSYDGTIMLPLGNNFISLTYNAFRDYNINLWVNFKGEYNNFYGQDQIFYFMYVCNSDPTYSKIFDSVEYRMDVYDGGGSPVSDKSFQYISVVDSYQNAEAMLSQSRRLSSDTSSLRKKFNVWRAQIPRESGSRNRMRDTWATIGLMGGGDNYQYFLHDISTKYTI